MAVPTHTHTHARAHVEVISEDEEEAGRAAEATKAEDDGAEAAGCNRASGSRAKPQGQPSPVCPWCRERQWMYVQAAAGGGFGWVDG